MGSLYNSQTYYKLKRIIFIDNKLIVDFKNSFVDVVEMKSAQRCIGTPSTVHCVLNTFFNIIFRVCVSRGERVRRSCDLPDFFV